MQGFSFPPTSKNMPVIPLTLMVYFLRSVSSWLDSTPLFGISIIPESLIVPSRWYYLWHHLHWGSERAEAIPKSWFVKGIVLSLWAGTSWTNKPVIIFKIKQATVFCLLQQFTLLLIFSYFTDYMATRRATPGSMEEVQIFVCLVVDKRIQSEPGGATHNERLLASTLLQVQPTHLRHITVLSFHEATPPYLSSTKSILNLY